MSLFTIFRNVSIRNRIHLKTCICFRQDLFSSKAPAQKIVKEIDPNTGEVKRKKTAIIPKVTLLSGDSIQITTLEEAQRLSKRRDLRLVKIVDIDAKTKRPVYKLMSGSEYHAEDLKQRQERKNERQNAYLKDNQIRKAAKWIDKNYEVRVVISGASTHTEAAEKIYSSFEKNFQTLNAEAKFVQKRLTGSDMKFQILPPKQKNEDTNKNSNSNEQL